MIDPEFDNLVYYRKQFPSKRRQRVFDPRRNFGKGFFGDDPFVAEVF